MRWNLLLLLILPFFFSACASKRHASRGKSPVGQSGRPDPGNRDDAAGRGRKDNTARTPSRSLDTEKYIRISSSRSAARRVGKEGVSTLRSGWSPVNKKKKQ